MDAEETQEDYKSKFLCVVDRNKAILIIPAPSGYLLMNAPPKEKKDEPLENFAALSSAGDVIQYLMDLYGDWLQPPKQDGSYDAVFDLLDVGRIDPSPKEDTKELSQKPPAIKIEPPIEKPIPIKEVRAEKKPLEIAKADQVKAKKNETIIATKMPQKPDNIKKKDVGFICNGCGETYEKKPESCSKCSASAFDEIPKFILQEMSNEN